MALIKKSLIALILLVPFLFSITVNGQGIVESEPEIDNNGADIYHSIVGNQRAYIHFSLPRYNNYGNFMTSYVSNSDHTIKFFGSKDIHYDRNIWNPDTSNYNIFVVETMDEQGNFVVQYTSREEKLNNLRIFGTSDGIQINAVISYPGTSFKTYENVFYLFDGITYRLYWAKSNVHESVTVEQLPSTSGSPYSPGTYGTVDLNLNGNYLDVEIFYQDTFKLSTILVDDKSIFQNVYSAYYWTDGTSKFISMTYEDKDPVYLSSLPIEARPWTETVTWNLTTNEIRSMNKVEVFAYHDITSNRDIYTYVYMPHLVYDGLVSVTAAFDYQHTYYLGGDGGIKSNVITLMNGQKNNTQPSWEWKLLLNIFTGYDLGMWVGSHFLGMDIDILKGSLDQIQRVNSPSTSLVNKITTAWEETYETKVTIDTTSNHLYRLNWGNYDKFGSSGVRLIPGSFSFAEIVYTKDGRVNILDFNDIVLKEVIDRKLDPKSGFDLIGEITDLVLDNLLISIIIVLVILFFLVTTFSTVLAPFIIILNVFARFIASILTMASNLILNLISRPVFWIIAVKAVLIYFIYITLR